MKKHIYLYFSKKEQLTDLKQDDKFEFWFEYSFHEASHIHKNEYGRIKTNKNYYHILCGRLEKKDCPWCSSPSEVVKLSYNPVSQYTIYSIQCMKCGSRGPSLSISEAMEKNKEAFEEFMSVLWSAYKQRKPWDDGLVSPYEEVYDGLE